LKKKTNKIFVKSLEGNILIIIYRTDVTNTRNKKKLNINKNYKRGPYNRFTEYFKENAI